MDSSLSKMVNPKHLGKNFMSHPSFTDLATITFEKKNKELGFKAITRHKSRFLNLASKSKILKILRHNIHAAPSYEKSQSLVLSSSSISSEKTLIENLIIISCLQDGILYVVFLEKGLHLHMEYFCRDRTRTHEGQKTFHCQKIEMFLDSEKI